MKRLVDDKKQELLDNLLESVSVDNKGNVEVGKNLGVDGVFTVGEYYISDNAGFRYSHDFGGNRNEGVIIGTDIRSYKGSNGVTIADVGFYAQSKYDIYHPTSVVMGVRAADSSYPNMFSSGFALDGGSAYFGYSNEYDKLRLGIVFGAYSDATFGGFKLDFKNETEITMPQKSGRLVVDTDLNAKQSILYRHTVTFTQGVEPNIKGRFTFTDKSEKNTSIDSIQDLIAVFGNTDLQLSGCTNFDQPYIMEKIHVGNSVTDTKFFYTNVGDSYKPQDSLYSVFNAGAAITITDNVTAM